VNQTFITVPRRSAPPSPLNRIPRRLGDSALNALSADSGRAVLCDLGFMDRHAPLRAAFITSTPLNVREGSGLSSASRRWR